MKTVPTPPVIDTHAVRTVSDRLREPLSTEDMFVYPVTILMDRYQGSYSRAKWTAWYCEAEEIPEDAQGGDPECADFWRAHRDGGGSERVDARSGLSPWEWTVGFGSTPNEAEADLRAKLWAKRAAQ